MVRKNFEDSGLVFDPTDFGTAYRLSQNQRVNQILLANIPLIHNSAIEDFRNRIVDSVHRWRRVIQQQHVANKVLMKTVLDYYEAEVYLDNSHSPYRLKKLSDCPEFKVDVIHLIRDPRGVCGSLMRNSGLTAKEAINTWLLHQMDIARITANVYKPLHLSYEKLCRVPNEQLARIHEHCSLPHEQYDGNFKEGEHHILGNRMRLSGGDIRLDEKWRRELTASQRTIIENKLNKFLSKYSQHRLASIIQEYLDGA